MPVVTRAMSVTSFGRADALWRAAALEHHLGVFFLAHPGHRPGGKLEALPVGREKLRQEVDVPAAVDHPVVVAVEHRLLGFLAKLPFVEIGTLVGQEAFAILLLHQAHRELIEVIALPCALGREHPCARNVLELGQVLVDVDAFFLLAHCSVHSYLSGASRKANRSMCCSITPRMCRLRSRSPVTRVMPIPPGRAVITAFSVS